MARRKQSIIEDLIEMSSKLPWWCCALLAVVSYFLLHQYAIREIISPSEPLAVMSTAPIMFKRSIAMIGQYILPFVFIIGGLLSFFQQIKRKNLHKTVAQGSSKNVLDEMSWEQFEIIVGEYYRQKGYQVEEVGGGGADGGIDLIIHKDKAKIFIQCKH